jgi:hypothetical protein
MEARKAAAHSADEARNAEQAKVVLPATGIIQDPTVDEGGIAQIEPLKASALPQALGEEAPAPEMDPMEENRRMMRWAGKGMDNPLSQALAMEVWKSGVDFPEKMTLQQDKNAARAQEKMRSLEAALQRTEMMMADKALDRAQRASLAEQRNTLTAAIANETLKARREGYALQASLLPYKIGALESKARESQRGKPLSDKDKAALLDSTASADRLNNLLNSFDDKFAGWGAAGPAVRFGANTVGSWAPEDYQKMDNWWGEFEMFSELPMRHEMFGAALTATEKQAWANAQRVRASKDPEKVRIALRDLISISKRVTERMRSSLLSEGKNMDSIDALTGGGLNEGEDRIEVRRGKRKSDGATVIEYSDGTREIIEP